MTPYRQRSLMIVARTRTFRLDARIGPGLFLLLMLAIAVLSVGCDKQSKNPAVAGQTTVGEELAGVNDRGKPEITITTIQHEGCRWVVFTAGGRADTMRYSHDPTCKNPAHNPAVLAQVER